MRICAYCRILCSREVNTPRTSKTNIWLANAGWETVLAWSLPLKKVVRCIVKVNKANKLISILVIHEPLLHLHFIKWQNEGRTTVLCQSESSGLACLANCSATSSWNPVSCGTYMYVVCTVHFDWSVITPDSRSRWCPPPDTDCGCRHHLIKPGCHVFYLVLHQTVDPKRHTGMNPHCGSLWQLHYEFPDILEDHPVLCSNNMPMLFQCL